VTSVHLVALATSLAACVTDLRSRRIPNVLTFGSAAAALVFQSMTAGTTGAVSASFGWAVGLAVFFIPFALGGLGAGDVKLLAALGAWLGPKDALMLALYAGVAGGVLAIVVGLARGYLRQAFVNIRLLLTHWSVVGIRPLDELTLSHSAAPKLAYALPIFVGVVVTVWLH
jgi:prepilin peptidase CpaA